MRVCVNYLLLSDPADEQTVEIDCPAGYGRVLSGPVKDGDLYLDRRSVLHAEDGKVVPRWLPIRLLHDGTDLAAAFACVVRPGHPGEQPCERCRHQARYPRERFCLGCGAVIVREGRRAAP